MDFSVTKSASAKSPAQRAEILENPGFGRSFTDHMVTIEYDADKGWHDAKVLPYGDIKLDPANMALHYGQQIFEGLKAYRYKDGSIKAFRAFENAARFNRSAKRLAMPALPEDVFVKAIKELIAVDGEWVPADTEKSLYLRPFMFATEVGLGVRPANKYLFILIASPAGAYWPKGIKPVSVWLSEEYVRAAVGGTGEAKCAGNYAASLIAQAQAAEHGCDQVVWIDAQERRWIEEMGGMNLYFVYKTSSGHKLVTPKLTGSLLPGITRDSLLTLAKDEGYEIEEGRISVEDWRKGCESGEIEEVFACGTAAVITPVGEVKSTSASWVVNQNETGPITANLRKKLLAIQTGDAPDIHAWTIELAHKNA
jgi:branched-chain amino acid aminotransferase